MDLVEDERTLDELEKDERMFSEDEQHEDLPVVGEAFEGGLEVAAHGNMGDVASPVQKFIPTELIN